MEKLAWTEPDAERERLESLAAQLAEADGPADDGLEWPVDLWSLLEQAGATRWSLAEEFGGAGCPRPLLVQRYAQLAGGSLTAVFILSQHDAGVRRLQAAPESDVANRWLRCHRPGTSVHDRGDLASDDVAPAGGTTREGRRGRAGVVSP